MTVCCDFPCPRWMAMTSICAPTSRFRQSSVAAFVCYPGSCRGHVKERVFLRVISNSFKLTFSDTFKLRTFSYKDEASWKATKSVHENSEKGFQDRDVNGQEGSLREPEQGGASRRDGRREERVYRPVLGHAAPSLSRLLLRLHVAAVEGPLHF